MPRITKRFVETQIPPTQGQIIHRDSDINGFALRMTPKCKSFVVESQVNGVRRRVTIGQFGAMTIENARTEAQKLLAEMKLGIHPNDRRDDPTLAEVLEKFLEIRDLSPKSKEIYRSIIIRTLSDWLNMPITAISTQMIQIRHKELVRPTRKNTDNKSDSDRAFHTLRSMMNFAKSFYEIKGKPIKLDNPVRDALRWRWHGTNVRTGTIPDNRLAEFYRALMAQPNKSARDFILLLLLTSLRRNEITTLKWTDINIDERTVTLSAKFNKSKREHILPLTDILIAIIKSRKALGYESPFVFPGRSDGHMKTGHMCEPRAVLLRLREQMGFEWIWHDLRRTALSAGEKAGLPYLALQRIANHIVRRDITDRYLILDLEYLRPHMDKMNDRLLKLMGTTVNEWQEADAKAGVEEPNNFVRKYDKKPEQIFVQVSDSAVVETGDEFYW